MFLSGSSLSNVHCLGGFCRREMAPTTCGPIKVFSYSRVFVWRLATLPFANVKAQSSESTIVAKVVVAVAFLCI